MESLEGHIVQAGRQLEGYYSNWTRNNDTSVDDSDREDGEEGKGL